MVYPAGSFLNVVLNFAVAQNEAAQVTMNWIPGDYSINDPATDAARIASKAQIWWTALKPLYTSGVAYQGLTAYVRPLTGPATQVIALPITNDPGSATGAMTPQECAACVSTSTSGAGRRTRGRMYLPSPAVSAIDTLGTLTPSTKSTMAVATGTLLNSLTGPAMYSVLWSRTTPSIERLVKCKVGAIMDVQRRRRSSAVESYTVQTIT